MSLLERARKAYRRLLAERNGHAKPPFSPQTGCEINEFNEQSPIAPIKPDPAAAGRYMLLQRQEDLGAVAVALDGATLVGLDTETTGLDPRADRVRLLSISVDTAGDEGRFTYLVDCFAVDPSTLWPVLTEKDLVLHNAAFDLQFLSRMGFTPAGKIVDTMLLAQLLTAGTYDRNTLAARCERYLERELDKTEQKADWTGNLTPKQIEYAAVDVEVLAPLLAALQAKIAEAKLGKVAELEHRALLGFVWLGGSGVAFDRHAWDSLTAEAVGEAKALSEKLDAVAPQRPGFLAGGGAWSWDSPQQVKAAFEAAGIKLDSTDDEALANVTHPIAGLLRDYRAAQKRVSTYGTDWSKHAEADSRIYASWRQIGSRAGRTSCPDPNLQQVPRDPRYRRCFIAPEGRILLKADYGQLQLRIAAKIADEQRMLEAYGRGEDLHTLTAQQLTGKPEVTKADRQLAKAVNFGLLFGLGAPKLRGYAKSNYGIDLTEDEAATYRRAFFTAYPGLARWHRQAGNSRAKECRTLGGRRRLLDDKTPFTHRLNTPVQGTEADGAKLALALLWERREQVPGAFPVLFVHDEIVIEADIEQAGAAAVWLKTAMVDAMAPLIAPVPVEVEVKVARTWGGARARQAEP
jgi:DNA polymerase I-like protein with 3'-5' exonuclease and polymerase domains